MQLNKILCSDTLEFLRGLPDSCVDLIITSPPYNKGWWSKNRNPNNGFGTKSRRIDYGVYDDKRSPQDYALWQKDVLYECCRVLKDTGSIFYNHIDILNEHLAIHPLWVYEFPVKQIIVWNKKNTPRLDKSYFFPITEYFFWIKKRHSSRPFFNRKNGYALKSVWEFNADVRNPHPAPFPESLVENIIRTCSEEGAIVCDPFVGSGTTAVVAKRLNRSFIGCDLNPEYVAMSNKRLGVKEDFDYPLMCMM